MSGRGGGRKEAAPALWRGGGGEEEEKEHIRRLVAPAPPGKEGRHLLGEGNGRGRISRTGPARSTAPCGWHGQDAALVPAAAQIAFPLQAFHGRLRPADRCRER